MDFDTLYSRIENLCSGRTLSGYNGAPVTARLEITGEHPGVIGITGGRDGITLRRGDAPGASVTAQLSSQTADALLSGRLRPMQAVMSGKVRVSGNTAQLMALMKYIKS